MKLLIAGNRDRSELIAIKLGINRVFGYLRDKAGRAGDRKPILSMEDFKPIMDEAVVVICDADDAYVEKLNAAGFQRFYVYCRFVIFGAGLYGRFMMDKIGEDRVCCFLDNHKAGTVLGGKKVASLSEASGFLADKEIIIASPEYGEKMERQLRQHGITNYKRNELFPECEVYSQTIVMTYAQVLSNNHLSSCKRIAVYGTGPFLAELLCEILFQCGIGSIAGIVDENRERRERKHFMGFPLHSLEELENEIDCLILNVSRAEDTIKDVIEEDYRRKNIKIIDVFDIDKFIPAFRHPELRRYKDKYKDKRAFIIGNGPSLRVEDLEILHINREICFSVNKIYKIYEQTSWRPDYLCICDENMMESCRKDLDSLCEGEIILADRFHCTEISEDVNRQYVHLVKRIGLKPQFSDDITVQVFRGGTVTYDIAMQMAAYMGFREIYLLGIDCDGIGKLTDDRNHFIKGYFTDKEKALYKDRDISFSNIIRAYETAEEYSRKHGFRIYNATRGGKLEVFERVDFDSLFQGGTQNV